MSALATQEIATVPRDLVAARARLREMREWIEEADDPAQIGSAVQALYEVREWARIRKVASDLRVEAMRLEAVALRRIAQMGEEAIQASGIPNNWRNVARGFAGMEEQEFAEALDKWSGETPSKIWRLWTNTFGARREGALCAVGAYERMPQRDAFTSPDALAKAARVIVGDALTSGMVYTHDEATDLLIDALSSVAHDYAEGDAAAGGDVFNNPHFRRGVSDIVKTAVSHARREDGAPLVVPVETPDHGWIQVPWAVATLDQLDQMARRRERQAQELATAAAHLTALAARMRRMAKAAGCVEDEPIGEIERRWGDAQMCSVCHLTKPCDCEAAS